MKRIMSLSWGCAIVAVTLSATLSSFSGAPGSGAHSVQIYLDNKLIIEQYLSSKTGIPKVVIDPAEKYNQLIVRYNECGRTVSGRSLTLKDSNNKVLKGWRYEGPSTGFSESMSCLLKDVIALRPTDNPVMKLYYASSDFPAGQQVAFIVIGNKSSATLN